MNTTHSFIPSKLNQTLCASCYRTADSHSTIESTPVCESCPNTGVLTKVNNIWLCQSCLDKELETPIPVKTVEVTTGFVKSALSYMSNELNKDHTPIEEEHKAINTLGSQAIGRSEEFFNARTMAINDRWKDIIADDSINIEQKHYELAKEVREHFLNLKNVLFTLTEQTLETTAGQRADQVYLNTLATKLREEERVKLHLANIDYTPPPPKNAPKVRVNKDDAMAASYAKIMGIPIETARRLINNKLKEVLGDCTCKETPGICKLHK